MSKDANLTTSLDIDAVPTSCVIVKLEADDLPADTQISYHDGKIILNDSIGNSVKFEADELTILRSKTIVVNSSAYIITAPNVECLAGKRYYVADSKLCSDDLDEDLDDDDNDNDNDNNTDADDASNDSDNSDDSLSDSD